MCTGKTCLALFWLSLLQQMLSAIKKAVSQRILQKLWPSSCRISSWRYLMRLDRLTLLHGLLFTAGTEATRIMALTAAALHNRLVSPK